MSGQLIISLLYLFPFSVRRWHLKAPLESLGPQNTLVWKFTATILQPQGFRCCVVTMYQTCSVLKLSFQSALSRFWEGQQPTTNQCSSRSPNSHHDSSCPHPDKSGNIVCISSANTAATLLYPPLTPCNPFFQCVCSIAFKQTPRYTTLQSNVRLSSSL